MSTYRVEWPCCGIVTETESYEPDACPVCVSLAAERARADDLGKAVVAVAQECDKLEAERDRLRAAIEQFISTYPWGPDVPELAGLRAALAEGEAK